ncbi:HlyD family efflux transporter periplasmic adaptor subunit, partial [Pirellulales bacterium]|nr:HlyD family efflux transporter periplasmic adaptor subunit [Pirellulales bacterium]
KELEAAETKLQVLEQFTKAKMTKQFESDILISKSKWEAEKNSHALELEKLAEAKDQVAKTVITAPRDGIVTYAHDRESHRSEEFVVEEGAMIRERQTIIELPDSTSMRVAVTVNESLIQFVKKGMLAKIRPVGLGKTVLRGKVASVNQYAEPSGWRKANVKEYKAYVAIDETVEGLRSGMTASVTIECLRADDVVQTPVQSIYAHGNDYYCLVFDRGDWQATRVDIGPTNDTFYVISGGLDVGQRVAMDPKRYLGEVDLPALTPKPTPADKKTPPVASAPKA